MARRWTTVGLVVVGCATASVFRGMLFDRFGPDAAIRVGVVWLAVFGVIVSFAVWISRRLELPNLLVLTPTWSGQRWRRFLTWGVIPGLAISLANAGFYRVAGGTAPVPWWSERVADHLDIVILSATAAVQEETLYRLFAISFLVAMGMRFRGWRPRFAVLGEATSADPPAVPAWMIAGAVVVTAILFGLRHPHGEIRATLFGLLLGWIFLRGGWESAVTAHFLGNYLLFAAIYL